MKKQFVLIGMAILIAAAFAIPVGADSQKSAGSGGMSVVTVEKTLDFCKAWSYTSHDANVSLTIEKCDDSKTCGINHDEPCRILVLNVTMRPSKNATLTVKDAKAKVESKAELKSLSAGACTAASKADCVDAGKSGTSYTDLKPTYDKGTYLLADMLTEKDLPKTYKLTFDKDDKLEGVTIKLGTNTEALTYSSDANYVYIYDPSTKTDITFMMADGALKKFIPSGTIDYSGDSYGKPDMQWWQMAGTNLYFGEKASTQGSTVTCSITRNTPLFVQVDCKGVNTQTAWLQSRFYAGFPFYYTNMTVQGSAYTLSTEPYWSASDIDTSFSQNNSFSSMPRDGAAHVYGYNKPFLSLIAGDHRISMIGLNQDDLNNFGMGYGSGWNPPSFYAWQNAYGATPIPDSRPAQMFWYYPAGNTTPATDELIMNDQYIFTRLVTGLTVGQGSLLWSTNISMEVEAAAGTNDGCNVSYTSNASVLSGGAAPMFAECTDLFGTNMYIYNGTGGAVSLWQHGTNTSGGWTWTGSSPWNDTYADTFGNVGALFTGNDVSFFITNISLTSGSLPYSNIVISPASPQTYPMVGTQFNITWNSTVGEVTSANLTFNGTVFTMLNASKVYYVTVPGGVYGAGTYGYVFSAEDTAIIGNSTVSANYVVNQAAGSATASSTGGWAMSEFMPTTLGCTGTTPALYLDLVPVTNPYSFSPGTGTYSVDCISTDTVNYTLASDNKTLSVTPTAINMTALDEATSATLTFNVTLANSSASYTVNGVTGLYMDYSNVSLPRGNITLTFTAAGYVPRNYYLNIIPGSNYTMTAHLLTTVSGSYVRFHTLTGTGIPIPGVLVTVNRTILGSTTIVQQQLSDAFGISLTFLNPLVTYTIYAEKAGYAPQTLSIAPSLSDYNIFMSAGSNATSELAGVWFDVHWSLQPSNATFLTEANYTFNFTVQNFNCSLTAYGMNITLNGTQVFSGTGNTSCGGSIADTLNLTGFNNTVLTITFWWDHSVYGFYSRSIDYYIWPSYGSGTLWDTLMNVRLNSCGGPMTVCVAGVCWCIPLAMITLLVMLLVGAGAGIAYGTGGGSLGAAAVMWLFTLVNWFPWQIATLLSLVLFGLVVLRRV